MHRRAKTILDLVSTGRLDRLRCHAMPAHGAACHHLRREDSDKGIDQVSCGVIVRYARRMIGRLIEADWPSRGLQPEGALRHRSSCSRLNRSASCAARRRRTAKSEAASPTPDSAANAEASTALSWRACIGEAPLDTIKQSIISNGFLTRQVGTGRVDGHRTFSRGGSYQWMSEQGSNADVRRPRG